MAAAVDRKRARVLRLLAAVFDRGSQVVISRRSGSRPIARESISVALLFWRGAATGFGKSIAVRGNVWSARAAAALGVGVMLVNILVALFTGLSTGSNVHVAHLFGADDAHELAAGVASALACGVFGGMLLGVAAFVFAPAFIGAMETPDAAVVDAVAYLRVYSIAIVAVAVYNMAAGVLRAVGDSATSFFAVICRRLAQRCGELVHPMRVGLRRCRRGAGDAAIERACGGRGPARRASLLRRACCVRFTLRGVGACERHRVRWRARGDSNDGHHAVQRGGAASNRHGASALSPVTSVQRVGALHLRDYLLFGGNHRVCSCAKPQRATMKRACSSIRCAQGSSLERISNAFRRCWP